MSERRDIMGRLAQIRHELMGDSNPDRGELAIDTCLSLMEVISDMLAADIRDEGNKP